MHVDLRYRSMWRSGCGTATWWMSIRPVRRLRFKPRSSHWMPVSIPRRGMRWCARIDHSPSMPAPGAAVRIKVRVGAPRSAVAIPVNALRKGPGGDQVFVIGPDGQGKSRAHLRQVESGAMSGDDIIVHAGLSVGEQVAASGAF